MTLSAIGTSLRGEAVHQITLRNTRLKVNLWTLGARIQDVRLAQVPWSLTAGSSDLAAYDDGPFKFFGCLVGPTAGRLRGATAPIGSTHYAWPANAGDNLLHGGDPAGGGWHTRVWQIESATEQAATLTLTRTPEDDGFPGHRRLKARFELDAATLRLTLTAETDALTLLNPANHSFWTLDGPAGTPDTRLSLAASHYLATRPDATPVSPPRPVADTPFDFREPAYLPAPGTLDHCFCLADAPAPLRPVAWLQGARGVALTLATTAPGLVVFDGKGINGPGAMGHDGIRYTTGTALALEPQHWPDAPNLPGAASIEYGPETPYRQQTEWRFSRSGT